LRLLASLEQASHHVVAGSIIGEARKRGLALSHPGAVQEHRGSGLDGLVDGTAGLPESAEGVLCIAAQRIRRARSGRHRRGYAGTCRQAMNKPAT
jgi:cation transport ATPase